MPSRFPPGTSIRNTIEISLAFRQAFVFASLFKEAAHMIPRRFGYVFAVSSTVFAVSLNAGCGPADSETESANGSQQQQATDSGKVDVGKLKDSVGQYMPALLGGRLEIAPPQGWDWKRPGAEYIVGFVPTGSELSSLPRILVSTGDNPYAEVTSVGAENVEEFADLVSARQTADELSKAVQPVILGENVFVCYETLARRKNAVVAQHSLETVVEGQQYIVRLDVYQQKFATYRDAVYTVAWSMKFAPSSGTSADVNAAAGADPDPADPPADS